MYKRHKRIASEPTPSSFFFSVSSILDRAKRSPNKIATDTVLIFVLSIISCLLYFSYTQQQKQEEDAEKLSTRKGHHGWNDLRCECIESILVTSELALWIHTKGRDSLAIESIF